MDKTVKIMEGEGVKCVAWPIDEFQEGLKPENWKRDWKEEHFLAFVGLSPPEGFRSVAGSGLSIVSPDVTDRKEVYGVDVFRDGVDKQGQPVVKVYHYGFFKIEDRVIMPLEPQKIEGEHYVRDEQDFERKHKEDANFKKEQPEESVEVRDNPDAKFCADLLKQAEVELLSAQTLYEKGIYPTAVHLFQQSVEKANKALGVKLSFLTVGELKNVVRHEPLKIHKRAFEQQLQQILKIKKAQKMLPSLRDSEFFDSFDIIGSHRQLKGFLKYLHELELTAVPSSQHSVEEIQKYVSVVDSMSSEVGAVNLDEIEKQALTEDDVIALRERIKKAFESLKARDPVTMAQIEQGIDDVPKDAWEKCAKLMVRMFVAAYEPYAVCLVLAILTHRHFQPSRYPDEKTQTGPSDIYTADHPLVKMLPPLFSMQAKAIKGIKVLEQTLGQIQ